MAELRKKNEQQTNEELNRLKESQAKQLAEARSRLETDHEREMREV